MGGNSDFTGSLPINTFLVHPHHPKGARMQSAISDFSTPNSEGPLRFDYQGENGAFFGLFLKNIFLTLITLGIYSFWAKVSNTQYIYQHLKFHGRPFNYHATGKELFIGFLKGVGILFVGSLCIAALSFVFVKVLGPIGGAILLYILLIPGWFMVLPFIIQGKFRFWFSRTSWSNIRFRFDGEYKPLLKLFVKTFFLSIITLGLYTPYWINHFQAYYTNNISLGKVRFQYTGVGRDLFWIYVKGLLLTLITVGIYYPWFIAKVTRYIIEKTTIADKGMRSNITGGQYFSLIVGNLFIILFTLGLGIPVAINRQMRVFFSSIQVYSDDTILTGIAAIPDTEASALAGGLEQAAEAMDAVSGLM